MRRAGVARAPGPLTAYASTEIHSCNQKAIETLGLGSDGLRRIPVKADYTIDLDALEKQIAADRADGRVPFCVIATAGTINTGAIDDLNAIADLCEREKLWFHVDGAYGAPAAAVPEAPDDLRIAQEVALLADRCDVNEVLARWRSHFDQLAAVLACTFATRDNHAFRRLFLGTIGDDQATSGFFVAFDATDQHAVMKRFECHF